MALCSSVSNLNFASVYHCRLETKFQAAKDNPKDLGDAIAAISLFGEVQKEAKVAVQQSSLSLIRLGDERRIPEMVDILEGYGDKRLAEDYFNCGQPDLNKAGRQWFRKRNYRINRGRGSVRARWGRGN